MAGCEYPNVGVSCLFPARRRARAGPPTNADHEYPNVGACRAAAVCSEHFSAGGRGGGAQAPITNRTPQRRPSPPTPRHSGIRGPHSSSAPPRHLPPSLQGRGAGGLGQARPALRVRRARAILRRAGPTGPRDSTAERHHMFWENHSRWVLPRQSAGDAPPGYVAEAGAELSVVETADDPFTELVASWNAGTPAGTALRVEARLRYAPADAEPEAGAWGAWRALGHWGQGGPADAPLPRSAGDEDGQTEAGDVRLAIDTLRLAPGLEASAFQVRLTLT